MTDPPSVPDSAARRVPAEWEPQDAVWLAWPHNRETWPGRFAPVPEFFARYAREIAESVPVRLLASPEVRRWAAEQPEVANLLPESSRIEWVEIATNDCWIRDYGPTFVLDRRSGRLHAVTWQFNAWGGKYPPWDLDAAAGRSMARHAGIPAVAAPLCLEGGALETDGTGRMLTSPSCLVTDTRNPGWSREEIAQQLHHFLGVTEIVWLDGGSLAGDDTDGHIDQLARFLDRQQVVAAVCEDPGDPNHRPLETNYRQLRLWGASTDPPVEVHPLPIPPARFVDRARVPESYCNFLRLGPDRMLVPTFGDRRADDRALGTLRELLPSVTITGLDSTDLSWGLGALHCCSRDQPRVAPSPVAR